MYQKRDGLLFEDVQSTFFRFLYLEWKPEKRLLSSEKSAV